MNIIYLTAACAQGRFDKLVSEGKITKMPQAQKYHHLLLCGLRKNTDDEINVVSSYPIVKGACRKYPTEKEMEEGINYIYPGFIQIPFIRQILLFFNGVNIIRHLAFQGNSIIVCDVLNGSLTLSARFLRLFKGIKIVGIVTDVPGLTSGARAKLLPWWKRMVGKAANQISKRAVKKYDGYLLLTEAMNQVVNPNGKPYIVIEGHSDISMGMRENQLAQKDVNKTLMYAGGTHKEFGIKMLVDAFLALNNPEWVLHIYGDGNYQEELKQISKEHQNVKYFGMKPNAEVVDAQLKAWLLVNPRITNAEYIKYSFPSKTLECMVSGTPLLTTRLAGMPKEYYPYVYLFDEETQDGFENVLSVVFATSAEDLHAKGTMAKKFALEEKNNVMQATKFYNFLKGINS